MGTAHPKRVRRPHTADVVRKKTMNSPTPLQIVACFTGLFALSAQALLRPQYEDATVVARSELIAVAHLKPGSIEYVPHDRKPQDGATWEHHATLVITQVLKGHCDTGEVPVVIHYGLNPVVGGYVKRDNFMLNVRGGRDDYPKDIIEIFDTGNSAAGGPSLVKDARDDNLWFLRRRSGVYGREPGTGSYGIVDPEDLQPLALTNYFLAYLSDDPASALREQMRMNPAIAERAQRYLDHLDIQRILTITSCQERLDQLLPYYLNRVTWDMKNEARAGIVSCGSVAGDRLRELFDNPDYAGFRGEIMLMWRDIGYRESVPLLIDLLKTHDAFWAAQVLQTNWWNSDVGSVETGRRRQIYSEVYYAVCALRSFNDPRSLESLTMTRDRWQSIRFDNPQILEECEAALRKLSESKEDAQQTGGAYVSPAAGETSAHP